VTNAAENLKALREATRPKLSVRAIAGELGIAPSAYQHYEDPKKFKRPYLPMDFVRSLVPVLGGRGISEAAVLALGGVDVGGGEHVPIPPMAAVQYVTMRVALPSEAALTRMFEGLLLPIDPDLSRAELARTLAQRLPIGLAQVQDLLPQPARAGAPEADEAPPTPATNDRALPRQPRT
jgi:hypothetical protein